MQADKLPLATAKPRLVHWFCQAENHDLLLQRMRLHCSGVHRGECFTPLRPTLCIAPGDVRLGGSCSAMETRSLKFSTPCLWSTLKASWSLKACSYWLCRMFATSWTFSLSLWCPCDEFTWISSLRLSFYCFQWLQPPTVDCGIYSVKIPQLYHTGIPELMSNPEISRESWEFNDSDGWPNLFLTI